MSRTSSTGSESTVDIPLNQWTHLALVFTNTTLTAAPAIESSLLPSYHYSAAVYVNGKLDVSLKFGTPVVGNEGAVHLFRDISHSGIAVLIDHIKL